jgi:hypothetical protein
MFKNTYYFLLFFLVLSNFQISADDEVKVTAHPKLPPNIIAAREFRQF